MDKFEFNLTPAYCLFNGVAVLEQTGANICFLIENEQNEILKARLRRAFESHLGMIQKLKDCPEVYRRIPVVDFVGGSRGQLRKCVSKLYSAREGAALGEHRNLELAVVEKEKSQRDAAAVLLLDSILNEARLRKATDIHIERNVVRLRINGHLEKLMEIQREEPLNLFSELNFLPE